MHTVRFLREKNVAYSNNSTPTILSSNPCHGRREKRLTKPKTDASVIEHAEQPAASTPRKTPNVDVVLSFVEKVENLRHLYIKAGRKTEKRRTVAI